MRPISAVELSADFLGRHPALIYTVRSLIAAGSSPGPRRMMVGFTLGKTERKRKQRRDLPGG